MGGGGGPPLQGGGKLFGFCVYWGRSVGATRTYGGGRRKGKALVFEKGEKIWTIIGRNMPKHGLPIIGWTSPRGGMEQWGKEEGKKEPIMREEVQVGSRRIPYGKS